MSGGITKQLTRHRYLYALLLPGMVYFAVFCYIPMAGLIVAFKDYSVFRTMWDSPWVGLKHFQSVFRSSDFWQVLRNTLFISAYKIIAGFPAPILLALLLNEIRGRSFKRGIQTVLYLPHFLSWVVLGGIMLSILSPSYGILGGLFKAAGQTPVNVMATQRFFPTILVLSQIWKSAGWSSIIYLSALAVVDPQLYEAARVDGAGRLRQALHVTLPCISGVIVLMLILNIGNLMEAGFEQIQVLLNNLVRDVGDIFDTYVYRKGIRQGNYSFTAAVGLFKSLVAMVLILGADRVAKLIGEEGLF